MTRPWVKASGPLMAVCALGAFWFFAHGRWSSASVTGFAETVEHPAAPALAGTVAEVLVTVGQQVKAGEVLARMDTKDLERRKEAAAVALAEAQASLAAEDIVQKAAVARAELLVLRLENAQNRNRAQLAEAEAQVARLEGLAAEQLVPAGTLEQSRLRRAGLAASVATLDDAKKQHQAGLGKPLKEQVTREQVELRLAPFREVVRQRQLGLDGANDALERATLRASVDGAVAAIVHWPGDVVPAGTEVVRVVAGRPGIVVCWLPERDAARATPGRAVRLRERRVLGQAFDARIREVGPVIEEVPLRARENPSVASWGRRIVIETQTPRAFILGEAMNVEL